MDTGDTGIATQLVNGSSPVAHLAPNTNVSFPMLACPASIALAEVVFPSAGAIIARLRSP